MICNPTASSGKVNVEELAELFAKAARGETVTVNGETVVWNGPVVTDWKGGFE